MNEKENKQIINAIVKEADKLNDLSNVYMNEDLKNNVERLKVSTKTIENVVRWAIGGATTKEIAKNLELTPKDFQTLLSISPALIWALSKGEELAQIQLSATAYELAMGGRKCHRQVLGSVKEYDENGRITRTYQEPIDTTYELEPNANLIKFLLTNHIPNRYGELKKEVDSEKMKEVVETLSADDLTKLKEYAKTKDKSIDIILNGNSNDIGDNEDE